MSPLVALSNKSTFEWKYSYLKVPIMGSNQNFFVFNLILMKLGDVVVSILLTVNTVEVHGHNYTKNDNTVRSSIYYMWYSNTSNVNQPHIRKTAFNASPAMLLNKFCSLNCFSHAVFHQFPSAAFKSICVPTVPKFTNLKFQNFKLFLVL